MPLRTSFAQMNCSFARAIDVIGDPWTLLVLRECFLGVERFEGFMQALGLARNVLADRLQALVAEGVLEKLPVEGHARHHAYRLTEKGEALLPAMVALMQWGDVWISGAGAEPILAVGPDGAPLAPVGLRRANGRPLRPQDVRFAAGPGAEALTRGHLAQLQAQGRK
ncbi:helix-turn-helix domain-containing protein [Niveibacterium sp. SC-1]|uniref:winged helix-turn-helix transcriptional regulator n=1 Tax=Niveibacterium sp. SC-1 TaxID=3135646 RepID=UPI00311E8BF1